MKIIYFLFVFFIQRLAGQGKGRRRRKECSESQKRKPFSLKQVKNKKLGRFLQRMKVLDIFVDCFQEEQGLVDTFLRLSKHSAFYFQFYQPPPLRRHHPDFSDNFYVQVQQSLERQFDFEYRHLLLQARPAALGRALRTVPGPSSEQCSQHSRRMGQYLQVDTSDILLSQVQQFEVRVHRLALSKLLSNVRVRYLGFHSESQQIRVLNHAFDLFMSEQYEVEVQLSAFKEVIQSALHLVFLVEGCPLEVVVQVHSQQTANMFRLKHFFFDYFNDHSPPRAQQQDVITTLSLFNPFGVDLFIDELSLVQQNHKSVVYFRLFGRAYQKIRYDSVDEREKLQLTLMRVNSQKMVDLVFDNKDAEELDDLPNEIQGFVSIKMSSRTLSFWFMVPYQIKLSLHSQLKVPSYLDMGTFHGQYSALGIFNKAVLMVSTGSAPVQVHDMVVSVDSALFDINIRVNQKHIQQGNRVMVEANLRKQSLGSLQLRLKKSFHHHKLRPHFQDPWQIGLLSIYCLVDKVFSVERIKIFGKVYPYSVPLSLEGPYLILNNKSIKEALKNNMSVLQQHHDNYLHLQTSVQDDHLQVQLLKDYPLPTREEGPMHAFHFQEIDAGQHSSLSAPHTLLKILRNIRIKLVYQHSEGRQNTLLRIQFQINYALNHVCVNPCSICALLRQPCYLPAALLSPMDFQLSVSNYKTFFQISDENHQHQHPLFIFDGGLLCVSSSNELQKLVYIHKHINNFSLEQYLCRHQSIDLGTMQLHVSNRKTFFLVNKNPLEVVMSYFDIEGEFVYQDYYSMSFLVRKYGHRHVLARNIQDKLVFDRLTVYQVTIDIRFHRPITSALADLQLIYESKYEDQEIHLKYQLQTGKGYMVYEQQDQEGEGEGWVYSEYNSSILLVNKHHMDIYVNKISLRQHLNERKVVMKDQVVKVNNRHRYNIDLTGLLSGVDVAQMVQTTPPSHHDLLIRDYLFHYQTYLHTLANSQLHLLVESDLETVKIPFRLLSQEITLGLSYQDQAVPVTEQGEQHLHLGDYQVGDYGVSSFSLQIHNPHFQPVMVQTMVGDCPSPPIHYPYIEVIKARLVVLHQDYLITCLGDSFNDFLEASFPRLSYDKYMISKEYLRYLAKQWQLSPLKKRKLEQLGDIIQEEGELCLQFWSEWKDIEFYKLWKQALHLVSRERSIELEQQPQAVYSYVSAMKHLQDYSLYQKLWLLFSQNELHGRDELRQYSLFQEESVHTFQLSPNQSSHSPPFYVHPQRMGEHRRCIYIKNSLNGLQVVNLTFSVLSPKVELVSARPLEEGLVLDYSVEGETLIFHQKYLGVQIEVEAITHTHLKAPLSALHSENKGLSFGGLQSQAGNARVLFWVVNHLDSWYSPFWLQMDNQQESVRVKIVFQYKYLSEQQLLQVFYTTITLLLSLFCWRLLKRQGWSWPWSPKIKVMAYREYANTVPNKAFSPPCLDKYLSSLHSALPMPVSQESKHQSTQLDESSHLLQGASNYATLNTEENAEYYQYFGDNLIEYKQLFCRGNTDTQQRIFKDVYHD